MPRAAAIFDLDGTLLGHGTAERLFVRRALRARVLSRWRVAGGALRSVAAWAGGQVATPGERKAWFAGADCRRLESAAVECVDADIAPRLRPALLQLLQAHREAERCTVLLTGTPDVLAEALARFLQVEVTLAARLERRGNRCTGRVLAPFPFAGGKRRALIELAARLDLDLAASYAYANRGSDAEHLRLVGRPCAVAPDRGLRRLARRLGWDLLEDDERFAARTRPGR